MRKSMKAINKVPFAPVVAIAFGLVTAALTFAIPAWRFAQMITATGLPTVLSAARPPLGDTARALAAISVGLGVCAALWIGLTLLRKLLKRGKTGQTKARGTRIDPVIISPSATSSTPAGQRSPIFAERDLGAPFMSDEVLSAQGFDADATTTQPALPAVDDELMLDPAWSDAEPEVRIPEAVAMAEPAPIVPPPPVVTKQETRAAPEPNQNLSDLIVRLDRAVEARSKRAVETPSGDILSLRTALDDLFETRMQAGKR